MKKKIFAITFLSLSLLVTSISTSFFISSFESEAKTGTLVNNINVSDLSEGEVRNYYASLYSNLNGKDLLHGLKDILSNGHLWFNYSDVWDTSKITERDWIQSPLTAEELRNYQYDDNPYVHLLYRLDNGTSTAAHIDDKHGTYIDREHLWSKSHGFSADENKGPAYADLHHLMLGDSDVNQDAHSNYPYAEVEEVDKIYDSSYGTKVDHYGIRGYATIGGSKVMVFEPPDQDKGDIARALFYMAARYSSFTSALADPWLELTDDVNLIENQGTISSNDTQSKPGYYGILSTLLEWHHLDPVSDYEIHRNNLIYNNYQHNRNPFIDFPSWADIAFGTSSGYANVNEDAVALVGGSITPPEPGEASLEISGQYSTRSPLGKAYDYSLIEVTYIDEYSNRIDVSNIASISEIDTMKLGNQAIKVTYQGLEKVINVFVTNENADVGVDEISPAEVKETINVNQNEVSGVSTSYGPYDSITLSSSDDRSWSASLANKGSWNPFTTGLNIGANTSTQRGKNKLPSLVTNASWYNQVNSYSNLYYFGMNFDVNDASGISFNLYNEKDMDAYIIYSLDNGKSYSLINIGTYKRNVDTSLSPTKVSYNLKQNYPSLRFALLIGVDSEEDGQRNRLISVELHYYSGEVIFHDVSPFSQAKAYAQFFLDMTSEYCGGSNASWDLFEGVLDGNWNVLSQEYDFMISEAKNIFKESSDSTILEARTRYQLVIDKYTSFGLNDFIGLGLNNAYPHISGNKNYYLLIVVSLLIFLVLTSITSIVIYKKKRQNSR